MSASALTGRTLTPAQSEDDHEQVAKPKPSAVADNKPAKTKPTHRALTGRTLTPAQSEDDHEQVVKPKPSAVADNKPAKTKPTHGKDGDEEEETSTSVTRQQAACRARNDDAGNAIADTAPVPTGKLVMRTRWMRLRTVRAEQGSWRSSTRRTPPNRTHC
ncbi:hypothetical protein BDY17DRAFT_145244 [Neohortaea acidophila]|uniref:Uncharacterized protein n=1 Tax=Neohortaea acidophila TaxID=245834 RepID=A0A6A6PUF2_9PEZI|nr:uncharacterized protein BDY17DRAFT_145244 [Neohortaea acidophila]KAF2483314.1 hypothetical protein BDY17DRAFT_145244 [Neohortaea acidophila]